MTEDALKKTFNMSTELAFDIVKLDPKKKTKPELAEQVDVVLETMFPGMTWRWPQQNFIARTYVRPELIKQYPGLASFNTAAAAIEALGETIEITSVKPCNGQEWHLWEGEDPIKPAP